MQLSDDSDGGLNRRAKGLVVSPAYSVGMDSDHNIKSGGNKLQAAIRGLVQFIRS